MRRVSNKKMPGVDQFLKTRANKPNIMLTDKEWGYGLLSAGDYPADSGYEKVYACSNGASTGIFSLLPPWKRSMDTR